MVADASPNTFEQKLTYIYETSSSSSNHLIQYSFMIYINTHKCFQMSSSSDNDVSDSDSNERVLKEPCPSNVPHYFLKTGKSKSEGVLITHSDSFKFTKNNINWNGTLHYYACAMKLTHKCPARAIFRREPLILKIRRTDKSWIRCDQPSLSEVNECSCM